MNAVGFWKMWMLGRWWLCRGRNKEMVYEMGKNIALKEFVEGFNKCEVVIAWPEKNKCKKLAEDFERIKLGLYNKMEYKDCECEGCVRKNNKDKVCNNIVDKDNYLFYQYLKEHCKNNEHEYTFLLDENIKAKIEVFEPFYYDGETKRMNQKWHIMISLLAFLDFAKAKNEKKWSKEITAAYEDWSDDEKKEFEKYTKKDFSTLRIEIDSSGKKVLKLENGGPYPDEKMIDQIMLILNDVKWESNNA